jgi:hypothetical protein
LLDLYEDHLCIDDKLMEIDELQSCLPSLAKPVCDQIAKNCRRQNIQFRKSVIEQSVLTAQLSHLARRSNVFIDKLLESLLTKNAHALQGNINEHEMLTKHSDLSW